VVLDGGRVVVDGPLREVLRRDEDLASLDITLPEPIAATRELRQLFPDLPADLMTEDDLERELIQRLGTP
jgi:hypothetical protein